jgi:hypothetical protein
MMETVRPSLTALIDLLGFSEHLALAKYDLRSAIGLEALRRLRFLEKTLSAIQEESDAGDALIPEGVRWARLNDSLLLQMDLPEEFTPDTGQMGFHQFPYEVAIERGRELGIDGDLKRLHAEVLCPMGREVAKFIGLAARMHNYLNSLEWESHFPGCRTVIACGLRIPFQDRNGEDDFLAANFSLTNAYSVQERGSSLGFRGPSIWFDDSVSVPISLDPISQNLLYFSQFVQTRKQFRRHLPADVVDLRRKDLASPECIAAEIQRQEFTFTKLDPSAASNLQLVGEIDAVSSNDAADTSILRRYSEILRGKIPTENEILSTEHYGLHFPFYLFHLSLDTPISKTLESLRRPADHHEDKDRDA